jgi:anti-sigma-K factor RskA
MTCQELAESFELYALGVLDGPEKDAIEEHLSRDCENCMIEINRAVENNAMVFRAVPKLDPPSGLRSRILAGFGLETRPFWLRALPWSVAAAAVAVLLLMIVYSARRNPADSMTNAIEFLTTPGTRQVSFGKDANQGPHGSVLMQQEKGMLLVVVNLPAAPEGKMYETWIVPRTGAPKPMGLLKATKNGDAVGRIPGPLDMASIQAVAVSMEPAGSDPVTPTTVIFAAPFGG